MNKYRNIKTVVDNISFASKAEARRYTELKILESTGDIGRIELQPRFTIEINGVKVCTYVADFKYYDFYKYNSNKKDSTGWVVEDVKGVLTPIYRLKKKLMKAVYNIDITEVK